MKTNKLTGAALDWAVGMAIGEYKPVPVPNYSTNWAQGGPIIEREGIAILQCPRGWAARIGFGGEYIEGPTPLIAAMRCYVANKLGDDVEVPEMTA